jgi:hypothetical protein
MRTFLVGAVVVGIVASAGAASRQGNASAVPSFEGVWKVTSVLTIGPNAANSIPDREPNINIWTKKYYARVTADGPARHFLSPPKNAAQLTGAEKLARYEHFRQFDASGGAYQIQGTKYFQQPVVSKDQSDDIIARTAGRPTPDAPIGQDIKFEGDRLILTQPTADRQSINRRTYMRLDRPAAAGTKPQAIEGAWKLTSTVITGANASANRKQEPNVYLFKNGYYGFVSQDGGQEAPPRRTLQPPKDAAKLTDAEKIARYEHWAPGAAQGGQYEMKGTTLSRYPIIAKNQSAEIIERYKTGKLGIALATLEVAFSNGNNTMVHTQKSADGKSLTTRTYTRLE